IQAGTGIVAVLAPGLATCNPFQSQLQAPEDAIGFDCINGIDRAGWRETAAVSEPGALKIAVEDDRRNHDGFDHGVNLSSRALASIRTIDFNCLNDTCGMGECNRKT